MSAPHRVGDPLPSVLVLRELEPILGLKLSQLGDLERAGELKRFELPRLGNRARYSGKKIQAWLDGDLLLSTAAPIFAKARGRP